MVINATRNRDPVPNYLLDPPKLAFGLELYAKAFSELVTCRRYEFGPIPWTEIQLFASINDFDGDQTDILNYVIPAINEAHIKHATSKLGAKNGSGKIQ